MLDKILEQPTLGPHEEIKLQLFAIEKYIFNITFATRHTKYSNLQREVSVAGDLTRCQSLKPVPLFGIQANYANPFTCTTTDLKGEYDDMGYWQPNKYMQMLLERIGSKL